MQRAMKLGVWLLEASVAAIMAVLVLVVFWGVFTRFLLGSASQWTQEAAEYLIIWLTFLGAAAGFRRWEHLGLDWMAEKLTPDARRVLEVISALICALFAGAALVWGGYVLVSKTLATGQVTTIDFMGLPTLAKGWVYLAAPLGGMLICLFSLMRAYRIAVGAEQVGHDHGDNAPQQEA